MRWARTTNSQDIWNPGFAHSLGAVFNSSETDPASSDMALRIGATGVKTVARAWRNRSAATPARATPCHRRETKVEIAVLFCFVYRAITSFGRKCSRKTYVATKGGVGRLCMSVRVLKRWWSPELQDRTMLVLLTLLRRRSNIRS
jgi:hypothetical protein